MSMRRSFLPLLLLAVACGGAAGGTHTPSDPKKKTAGGTQLPAPNEPQEDDGKRFRAPVGSSPTRGPKDALVTIVEFADFECPFCRKVSPTMTALLARYPNDVRIVWKNAPMTMHAYALPLARVALLARKTEGDAGFWKAYERITNLRGDFTDEIYLQIAESLNIHEATARELATGTQFKADLDQDDDLAEGLEVEGTPHFFINGRRASGARSIEYFSAIIDEELLKAKALVAKGTKREDVYATLQASASAPAPWLEAKLDAPPPNAPFRGTKDAPVVIQQFSDLECPFCRLAEDNVEHLLTQFKGKIKIVWRDSPLPMHKHARVAAEALHEAHAQRGDAGFVKMQGLLYDAQDLPNGYSDKSLVGYAQKLSLNVEAFKDALAKHKHAALIDRDIEVAKGAKLDGAPAFFIGDYLIVGAETYRRFEKRVERTLRDRAAK